jgi:choline/glycine/proline betaine transport protein
VVTFFVTSSDSGSLVIDSLTSGGEEHPHVWQRIFWASTEGIVAIILLAAGGLVALQTATIITALPFALIMLIMIYSLVKGLAEEQLKLEIRALPTTPVLNNSEISWQDRLKAIHSLPEQNEAKNFLTSVVLPTFIELRMELNKDGLETKITRPPSEMDSETPLNDDDQERYYRAEVHLNEGGQGYDVLGFSEEQLINDFLKQYNNHIHFLHSTR